MTQGSLQAALPREMYVDGQSWLAERETVLFGQWYCIGRLDDLGLTASSRVVVVDVVGESVLVTSDVDGRAARFLQRLPAPRVTAPTSR